MAFGIDPNTGNFLSPAYAATFAVQHPGVDPGTFIAAQQLQAMTQYTNYETADFNSLGGVSFLPFAPVVGGDPQALSDAGCAAMAAVGLPCNGSPPSSSILTWVIIFAVIFLAIDLIGALK
jgi:hypothetical protein